MRVLLREVLLLVLGSALVACHHYESSSGDAPEGAGGSSATPVLDEDDPCHCIGACLTFEELIVRYCGTGPTISVVSAGENCRSMRIMVEGTDLAINALYDETGQLVGSSYLGRGRECRQAFDLRTCEDDCVACEGDQIGNPDGDPTCRWGLR